MKKTLIAVAIAALVATAFSFGTAHWIACRHRAPMAAPTFQDVAWLKRELRLTDSQVNDLEKYQAAFQQKFNALCTAHCDARLALGNELAHLQPDPEKARACVERMNTAQADTERLTLDHILKIRTVLTNEQAQQYGKMVRDQVCSMMPGGTM